MSHQQSSGIVGSVGHCLGSRLRGLNGCFSEGFVSRVKLIFYIFNFLTAEIDSYMEKIIYTFNYFFLLFFIFLNIWQLIYTINAEVMKILFIFFYFLFGSFIFSCIYLFLFTIQHFYLPHLFLTYIFSRFYRITFTYFFFMTHL